MTPRPAAALVVGLAATLAGLAAPALAVMSGAESRLAPSGDADYAAGKEAFEAKRWADAILSFNRVVERRPWHDNAHALLGYAYRKAGDRERSFAHYEAALRLNPRHRGALEYLAESYLELDRLEEARATLVRLGEVCRFVVMAFDNQGWLTGCEEFEELRAQFAARGIEVPPIDRSRR